jgi:hypothetical protein
MHMGHLVYIKGLSLIANDDLNGVPTDPALDFKRQIRLIPVSMANHVRHCFAHREHQRLNSCPVDLSRHANRFDESSGDRQHSGVAGNSQRGTRIFLGRHRASPPGESWLNLFMEKKLRCSTVVEPILQFIHPGEQGGVTGGKKNLAHFWLSGEIYTSVHLVVSKDFTENIARAGTLCNSCQEFRV